MEFSDADRRIACRLCFENWRVAGALRRNEANQARISRIATVVWKACEDMGDCCTRSELEVASRARLRNEPDHDNLVSLEPRTFVPAWLLGIIINVIIKLLIDYFFTKRAADA